MSNDQPSGSGDDISVEFLVEPFTEGNPGKHVQAAIDAFTTADLEVDLGAFASVAEGNIDAIADAVSEMIRTSLRSGATAIRLNVGAPNAGVPAIGSLETALADMMRAAEREMGAPADDWDRAQKQAVVRLLDEQGAFLLRGAVDQIAEVMGVSRITIYNYLNALH